jgi:hypothetical protein
MPQRSRSIDAAAARPTHPGGTVSCVRGHARLADPEPELRRAHDLVARGVGAWQDRLDHYESGEAVLVELTGCVHIDFDVRPPETLPFCHEIAWLERPATQAELTERLEELAHRDFRPVGAHLRDRGVQLRGSEDTIPVRLAIDPEVLAALDAS